MVRTSRLAFFGYVLLAFFGLACGAILGIDEPRDRAPTQTMPDGAPAPAVCAATEKLCSGLCVARNDAKVGCGGACTACSGSQNAKASCVAEVCGLTDSDCNAGFGNCDSNPANGCETQLTTKAACGMCGVTCPVFCAPMDGGFGCSTSCDAPNAQCMHECVDPQHDPKHCGALCADCTVLNGAGTCASGTCTISCNAPFCLVGNACTASDDQHCYTASCGACGLGRTCDTLGMTGCVACTPGPTKCGPNCDIDCIAMGLTCGPAGQCITPTADAAAACFIAGTPVTLASGATKPIEEIEVGDEVLSYDTTTGIKVTGHVAQLFVHPHTKRLARLNGIVTTPEHRFYVNGAWVAAGALSIGDTLSLATITDRILGPETLATEPTVELLLMAGDVTTYNLEVAVFHDYFAGGYLVHNNGGKTN